jgi:hypothetical protein
MWPQQRAKRAQKTMHLTKEVAPTASKTNSENNASDKGCDPNSEQKEFRKQ